MGKIGEIIGEGFIAGIFLGVGIQTGISPDEAGIYTFVLKEVCKVTGDVANSFNCGGFIFFMIVLSLIITLVAIYSAITKVKDWRIGAFIYGVSFLVGLLLIIKN